MKKGFVLTILLSMSFFLTSCTVVGTVYKHDNIQQLKVGMTEQEVINILGAEPFSRSALNGGYLLQWQYSYGTALATCGARHLAVLFSNDGKMIKVTQDTRVGESL
ncbi:MAG: outer membrane protein assembly factor BamE [Sedimentisphaeraceae bacterium JB056]